MKRLLQSAVLILFLTGCQSANKKSDALRKEIEQIISDKNATVGVSIIGNNGKDTLSINGNRRFPLQSVFKFHIALAVLSEIDQGRFTLNQTIEIGKDALLSEDIWSPLRDDHPEGGSFTIARLIQYAVIESDNVACDVLIRLVGTPKSVEAYFKKNNIRDIAITFNEKVMQSRWDNMFENWTTPIAASNTLSIFYENEHNLLSKESHDFIWKTMKATSTGINRLKGRLPEGTIVAHKTGSSGTNEEGLTPATNDIGIVFLPDGSYFIISVFVTDSHEDTATNESIIADIAKAAYEHYLER